MRYSSEKRPHLFIETAKIVLGKIPNVQFVLVGDGPLMDQVARLVRRYELKKKFILLADPIRFILGCMNLTRFVNFRI